MRPTSTPVIAVPVDLAPWFNGDDAARDQVAAAVDHACSTSGFLAITGHGVPTSLMEQMLDVSTAFFALPVDEKLRYHLEDAAANRGYAPFESEALAYSLGMDSEPTSSKPSTSAERSSPTASPTLPPRRISRRTFGPTHQPTCSVYLEYWDVQALGHTLCEVFARALGLPDGFLRRTSIRRRA